MSAKREDNFVAGLSMGGYGAVKAALTCPDKYFACASLSGSLDITRKGCGIKTGARCNAAFLKKKLTIFNTS